MSGGVSATTMLAAASAAATIAGTLISVEGAEKQAQASSEAAQYNAAVAANNQTIANNYAARALQTGQVEAQQKEMATAEKVGEVRAAAGADDLDVNTGSPLRLSADTKALGATDAETIRNNAQTAAYGYQVQGMNFSAQANLDLATAKNVTEAGNLAAVGSVISGAGNVAGKWASFQQSGVPGFGP